MISFLRTTVKIIISVLVLIFLGVGAEKSGVFDNISGSSLSCSDKRVTDLVEKIYKERMVNKEGYVYVHNISTERSLDNGGKTCLADLQMKAVSEVNENILKAEYSYEERNGNIYVTSRIKLF